MRAYILWSVVLAAACSAGAQKQPAPTWVTDGTSTAYPASRYMSAPACAPTRRVADDRARADLAKQFSVSISQQFGSRQTYSQYTGTGPLESISVKERTRTETTGTLEGVSIARRYAGPDEFCSLAVLDRGETVRLWLERVERMDGQIAASLKSAGETSDQLERVAKLAQVAALAIQRDVLYTRLAVLGAGGEATEGKPGPVAAVTAYREARSRLSVRTEAKGPFAQRLSAKLSEGLSKCNIPTTDDQDAALVVRTGLTIEAGKRKDDRHVWLHYRFSATALNPATDAAVQTVTVSDEVGHRDRDNAEVQLLLALEEDTVPDFAAKICAWWETTLALPGRD